jgi:NhaP-type Na+/H+ or K+/H+ antiporter
MESLRLDEPAFTLALALAVGMAAQVLARHLRIPGIVLLLGAGLLLGPDVLDVIRPDALGPSLHDLVGFAVAVILFEGGMNLNLGRLRREGRAIRQLITVGAVVTAAGAALAARWTLGWTWTLAILFGTLVMVTGPTVINPLLRRINAHPRVATVLEAEGVLVDAVGAIVAVVALEALTGPPGLHWAFGAWDVTSRLLFAAGIGVAGGIALVALLRVERLIPEGLESVFTLSVVLLLYQTANALMHETGIGAAVAAGLVVGNAPRRVVGELREFKEQLSTLFIGLLFVLLAADVRLYEVRALGWAGAALVLALMFVVRPLNVLAGTWGTTLSARERAFLAWVAPRGIVAAAVSSLFADRLATASISGGGQLRAMVFLVIAATVVLQGLSAPAVAGWLRLRRPSNDGYVILGANALGRALAHGLAAAGQRVVVIDSNPESCERAESAGLECLHGSAFDAAVERQADAGTRAGCLGVTTNEEVNLMFARRARRQHRVPAAWVAIQRGHLGIDEDAVHDAAARLLFGGPQPLDRWIARLESGEAILEWWRTSEKGSKLAGGEGRWLPLLARRRGAVTPFDEETSLGDGDEALLVVAPDATTALTGLGLARV